MNGKKRIIALCVLLIVGGGWVGLASRYAGQTTQIASPSEGGLGVETRSFLSDPNSSVLTSNGLDNRDVLLRMGLALAFVIGLAALALYASRRVLPRAVNPPGREIRIIETTYLAPRKALHLVEVGARRLLIASTMDRITMLTSLDEMLPEDSHRILDDGTEM
ncbi:MAG: hypothetical protein GX448_03330 [Planctomycetes bacterium]|nr:hypothetical protein [Planctomycetota bacterium]